jgi:catechol 2,3-dioxygenase-like lactoylglutathione lyase family enzyme
MSAIRGLHHNAYRCRSSEQTRRFYEDFLGLPLAGALEIAETKTGRAVDVLHTFYRLGDGSVGSPGNPNCFSPLTTLSL